MKKKLELFEKFLEFKAQVKNQTNKKIKVLRTYNGGEFCGKELYQFCRHHGIDRQKKTPYMPQQNEVAERMNRTLMEKSKSMLSDASLTHEYWEKSVNTTFYLVNRSSMSNLVNKTPYEAWVGKRPSIAHLRVSRRAKFMHIPKEKRKKLDNKSKKCCLIGYKDGIKGYKLWNQVTRIVVYNRDVMFREDERTSKNEEIKREKES